MRISLKSWHYRLIKFVLKDNAPTPKTMQNGCPYFWLLILSIFALPFKLIGIALREIVMLFPRMFDRFIEYAAENWTEEIDDRYAYDLYYNGSHNLNKKLPLTSKLYIRKKRGSKYIYGDDFFNVYLQKKYNIEPYSDEFFEMRGKIQKDWEVWNEEQGEIRRKLKEERRKLQAEKEAIAYQKKLEWERKISPIQNKIDGIFTSIGDVFTIKKDWSVLIRRTKRFVGGLVTLLLLGVTFFIVSFLTWLISSIVDVFIAHWIVVVFALAFAAACGLCYLLYWLIAIWVQSLVDKYRRGKKVWYVEAPIYVFYMPLKYLVLAIAFLFLWVLWKPTYFGGYKILWLVLLFPVGKWVWKGLKGLWNTILGSTGIFGEYASASYTDYCPGIEWVDTEEE